MDDNGISRPGPSSASGAIDFARGEYDQQLKGAETKIDQLSRDLFEKTNENRALITEIRALEQGMKEIDQQLKQRPSQKGGSQAPFVIQCPSLEKMLQVLETQSLAGRYDNTSVPKSENDKLMGRIAELRDELYNARHDKTKADVNLKLEVERVRDHFPSIHRLGISLLLDFRTPNFTVIFSCSKKQAWCR